MFNAKLKKARKIISDVIQPKRVAIDIGLYSLKSAFVENELLCLNEFPLFEEPKDIRGLDQQELTEFQLIAIKRAMSMAGQESEIVLSPPPSLKILTGLFNRPPDTDLTEFLENELPFEPDQFTFDIQEVAATSSDKKSKKSKNQDVKMAVAATDLDTVHRSIELLGDYQRQVKVVMPGSVALLNYLLLSKSSHNGQPLVLLDLGATYSHLIVFKRADQFVSRTIMLGGNHFNLELVDKMNVDFETSEKIKFERKLIDDNQLISDGAPRSTAMFQAVNGVLYAMVDEIKNTMTYFEDFFMEDIANSVILLTGGASKLQNFDRFISKETGLPTKLATDSFHDLGPDNVFSPQFASTVGLLGSPLQSDFFNLNLIKNIDGMLFRLSDGDYYLTTDGFVDKKRYKKTSRSKAIEPSTPKKTAISEVEVPAPNIISLIRELRDRVNAMLRGEKVDLRFSPRQTGKIPAGNWFKIAFVIAGAAFLLIAGVNQLYWAPKSKLLNRAISSFLEERSSLNQAQAGSVTQEEDVVYTQRITKTDKILWTNKMKMIAASLPKEVWISNLEIRGSTEEFEGHTVGKRSLVISCHVASKTDGHLKTVAHLINNLKKQKGLLDDFSGVVFHSATRRSQDKDVMDFDLTFPLKRNMLIETIKTVVSEDGVKGVTDMVEQFKGAQDQRYKEVDSNQ